MQQYTIERLKFLTELFKLCWLSVLGVGGGSVSVLLGAYTVQRYLWAGAGLLLTLVLLAVLWHTHRRMQQLWNELTGAP